MFLSHLELVHYKNHEHQVFDFESRFNVFIGKNGIGKTNILDAIYYLANFRSHITSLDSQNILHGHEFFRLKGQFSPDHEVVVKFAPKNKTIEINGVRVQKYSEVFGHIPLVLASPADIFLLHDGSEERRKFLDYTISSFNKQYLHNLNQYHQYLNQRNALLKQSETPDTELILYYNQHLVKYGNAIFQERQKAIAELKNDILQWYEAIAKHNDQLEIRYHSQLQDDDLKQLLEHSLTKDILLKRTTKGIHRDDLQLNMRGQDLKRLASQGQQKSLLYALRLAQSAFINRKLQKKVIFLLDDFSDKLDTHRQNHLINIMLHIDFVEQWFISDTDSLGDKIKEGIEIFQLS